MASPSIDLSRVNITLQQFQEISSGVHNAGEVRLTSENSIDKVNHHVSFRSLNYFSFTQEEVLAIKNAFVKTLSNSGVQRDELNRIREELGLAPIKPVDMTIHERSIIPLSRQKIREILDRNAEDINHHLGDGTILRNEEIHARFNDRERETQVADRNRANSELTTRRNIVENRQINILQAVLAGDVDFYKGATRQELLDKAKLCLETVLRDCHGSPRADVNASITTNTDGEKNVVLSTGLSEVAFVRKLEDIIIRLSMDRKPTNDEIAIRDSFKELATQEERSAWATNLINDPQGALKARVVALMLMHERGIADAATLSVVNQLAKNEAIAFVSNLISVCMDLHGDDLRNSGPVLTALDNANPELELASREKAHIPAISDQEFNEEIASRLSYSPDTLPATFKSLVILASATVSTKFGKSGYAENATPSWHTTGTNLRALTGANNPNAPRITPDTLSGSYMNAAINAGSKRLLDAGVRKQLAAAGLNVRNPVFVMNSITAREPRIMERILAANTEAAALAVLDDYKALIADCARRVNICERCHKTLSGWAREGMAKKLNVAVNSFSDDVFTTQDLKLKGNALRDAICAGTNPADTEEEIEKEFKKLVDKFVDEHVEVLNKIDQADIPQDTKDAIKDLVLKMDKVNYLDIDAIVAAGKKISPEKLSSRLNANESAANIFQAMEEMTAAATTSMEEIFDEAVKKGKDIGPDEKANILAPIIIVSTLSRLGLEARLSDFLASDNVSGQDYHDEDNVAHPAKNFIDFLFKPSANQALAETLGTDTIPPFHARALVDAAREEGYGELSVADAIAMFSPGKPAGVLLKMFVTTANSALRASAFKVLARSALRNCKAAIAEAIQNMKTVEMISSAFLSSEATAQVLAAGYAQAELPKIAKTFALYKVAMNTTDEVALAAALDADSKASRLASYGGRFTSSVEDFIAGLKLMDAYDAWFAKTYANANSNNFTTMTERCLYTPVVNADAGRAVEAFLFEEIAINTTIPLDVKNPERTFGMENNPAMRFVGSGYTTSFANSLAQIPPQKRELIYAVFDVLDPIPKGEAPNGARQKVGQSALLAARIMKNYDAIMELRSDGKFDRANLVQLLYGDIGVKNNATNNEIEKAYSKILLKDPLAGQAHMMMMSSGTTFPETLDALRNGKQLPNAPYISNFNGHLEGVDGTSKEGRATMIGDLIRPQGATVIATGTPAIAADKVKFTVRFPDGTTLESKPDKDGNVDVNAATAIADKLETLCGKVHQKQLNSVYFALTQSSIGGCVNGGFVHMGIETNEHMGITFTLEKNNENGDVKIRFSEPEGLPFRFSWETTVHLDGSTETTPMVTELPTGFGYKAIAREGCDVPFTTNTIVSGNGPATTAFRNLVETRCGAPENAQPTEKATAFMNKVNSMATQFMSYKLATTASKNLVKDSNNQKHEDFESDHFQFKRDLSSGYKIFFSGSKNYSGDYSTNRDKLVKFVTDNNKATFATASQITKRKVGILMSLLTQYFHSMVNESVSEAMAKPGEEFAFTAFTLNIKPPEFRLSKDAGGNIKIVFSASDTVQGLIINNDDAEPIMVNPGSNCTYTMDINLPKENLDTLANADWTKYDREPVNSFDGELKDRINLIPEQYRFTGTVNVSYHMNLVES